MKYNKGEFMFLQNEIRLQISRENEINLVMSPSFATVIEIKKKIENGKQWEVITLEFFLLGIGKKTTTISQVDMEWIDSEIEILEAKNER